MKNPIPCLTWAGALLIACAPHHARAQTERELGAHEHGAATLDVVLDGAELSIDLDSPATNLLGFEHAPSTEAQRDAVARAERLLESGELLEPDAAASCALSGSRVTLGFADPEADHDAHDAAGAEAHHEGQGEHDEAAAAHADIEASWSFSCEAPDRLSAIATRFFAAFDGFTDIDVQVAGPSGQTLVELTPGSTTILLDPTP